MKNPVEYNIRRFVVIGMFIGALILILTGIILYLIPSGRVGAEYGKEALIIIHTYAGFATAGMFVIHTYLNRRPLKRYFSIK